MHIAYVLIFFTFNMYAGNTPSALAQSPAEKESEQPIIVKREQCTVVVDNHPVVNVTVLQSGITSKINTSAHATNFLQNTIDLVQSSHSMIPDSIKTNIPKMLIHLTAYSKWYMVGASYSSICAALIAGNHYINGDLRWARWKKETSMADFYAMTHKQISHELIHEIQRRYLNPKNPTDFLTPLITFINTIDYEVSRTNWYIRLATLISWCHLTMFFPVNETKLEQARRAQERLHFIKHIFVSWAGEYNVGHAIK